MTHSSLPFFLAVALLCSAVPAIGADAPTPRTLSVSGSGEVKAAPDAAQLSTGVITQGPNAAAALSSNARAMTAVFDTLKRAGIADKNIQTSGISLSPQYANKPGQAAHITGYQVSNTVTVMVDALDKVGPTLDALVAAGSNQIDGPNFLIADPKPLLAKARAEAVKDAAAKAQAYAEAAGVTLGPILSISESSSEAPRPMGRMMMSMAKAPDTPIAAGEESVSADVSITWEIH
jgi:uncharacterized protein YggE